MQYTKFIYKKNNCHNFVLYIKVMILLCSSFKKIQLIIRDGIKNFD